jgi:phospholipase/lecithinase/hemolysin
MKKSCLFWMILLLGSVVFSTASAFNSLYVFGDGICTTTIGPGGSLYYGQRYCNGRIWVEVLAQRQGIGISNNCSYLGQDNVAMVSNVKQFTATNAPTAFGSGLFVIWAGNADFVGYLSKNVLTYYDSYYTTSKWDPYINSSLTNHYTIITNLYAKGIRSLIMPNAVDVTEIPQVNNLDATKKTFVRGRIVYFNTNLLATVNRAKSACHGLTIYVPDTFALFDNVLTNAANYGLTNVLSSGQPISAMENVANLTTNGAGNNYIFWDPISITARMSEVLADTVQQMISPVQVGGLAQINGSNRVDMVNVPVGLNGFLEGCTNLASSAWTSVANFNSTATAQSVFVLTPPLPANFGAGGSGGSGGSGGPPMPGSGSGTTTVTDTNSYVNSAAQFYRLRFPYAWNWP